jgi:hypothetical protein
MGISNYRGMTKPPPTLPLCVWSEYVISVFSYKFHNTYNCECMSVSSADWWCISIIF